MLWISHVLIRHQDVPAGVISFELPEWTSAPPAPDRTRENAFELAQALADRASERPEQFEQLVREASEDVATRDAGGSLGGYNAFRLTAWPRVLDCMAALAPGQTSRVVETQFGFHVFKRRPPPPDERVSGARIIIGHDDAPWLSRYLSRGSAPKRSRIEARALAEQVYSLAKANPSDFARLVNQYSEHRDALRAGDFGEWSTREPTPYRRAVEILGELRVGAVAAPVDSLFGYQIIQRTAERPRAAYAMNSVRVFYDPKVPETDSSSRETASLRASEIANRLRSEPLQFAEYQRQLCCVDIENWIEGRGTPELERAIAALQEGEISHDVIEAERSFWIIQRAKATAATPLRISTDVPAPERANVEYLVTHSGWLKPFDEAWRAAAKALQLNAELMQQLSVMHDIEARLSVALSEAERVGIYRDLQHRLSLLLGPGSYERYAVRVEEYFREELMGQTASRSQP